jgi:V/A-type H+/Na+-transporting ATPase subunit A
VTASTADGPTAGAIVGAVGPVVRAIGLGHVTVGEVVHVGPHRLLGEVIALDGPQVIVQVYEETGGLEVGDPVHPSGAPLQARLGPGLLGGTFDGLQRRLDRLANAGRWLLLPGASDIVPDAHAGGTDAVPDRWAFTPTLKAGVTVRGGDVLGTVKEGPLQHRILVPPEAGPGLLLRLDAGRFAEDEAIGRMETDSGGVDLHLVHAWPIRRPRPVRRRRATDRPLLTGQRVFDMLFPIARGGTAVIPGGFGTGKTVVEQALARWSDADVVVYVGCGERGNEMAELLASFPSLVDPRSGRPLLERTVLIANTSNMPVAAREASIGLGITIAEYFRDQGLHVALLADSTSRWAEALREISGRLEELPGEEGYPAYLGSRLAAFYERAGAADALGAPERDGSITLVGAVSPPGGDFSEPVTQASLRLAGTYWALDPDLAHARHFPAVGWALSYSLAVDRLTPWYREHVDPSWADRRSAAIDLLAREKQLLDIVQLVGADALPDADRVDLETARLLRETFLQQHAFDPVDAARPPDVQFALLVAVLAAGAGLHLALERGAVLDVAMGSPALEELRRARAWSGDDIVARLGTLAARLADLGSEVTA